MTADKTSSASFAPDKSSKNAFTSPSVSDEVAAGGDFLLYMKNCSHATDTSLHAKRRGGREGGGRGERREEGGRREKATPRGT